MESETKVRHTPGAMRTARALRIKIHGLSVPLREADIEWLESVEDYDAAIIERETGLAELLAAAEAVCDGACWPLGGPKQHEAVIKASRIVALRAAIARAREGA